MHARQPHRRVGIDASDASVRVWTAYERRLQHAGKFEIVDETAVAPQQRSVFDPQHSVSDRVGISHAVNHLAMNNQGS